MPAIAEQFGFTPPKIAEIAEQFAATPPKIAEIAEQFGFTPPKIGATWESLGSLSFASQGLGRTLEACADASLPKKSSPVPKLSAA